MGWIDIPLDIVTSVIASVTIGIGVDDTIHFLNTFRHFRGQGNSVSDTISKTLQISGRAILYTSFSLVLGFSVLCLSSFTPVIMFGVLMSLSMVATTLGALVVLPACIQVVGIEIKSAKADSFIWRYFSIAKAFGFKEEN
jgi:predicted RND superfamily exporter protein